MTITINFNQTPKELILELFNKENGYDFSSNQIAVTEGYRDLQTGRRVVEVELLERELFEEVDIPYADISFFPIILTSLFSDVELELREIDIVDENYNIVPSKVYSELLRRYGVYADAGIFNVREEGGDYYLVANSSNQAYSGEKLITLTHSLRSRVASNILKGFLAKPSFAYEIMVQAVTPFELPDTELDMERLTWWQNFSIISGYLTAADGILTQPELLNNSLANMGIPEIPADAVVTVRTVRESQGENPKYTHIF